MNNKEVLLRRLEKLDACFWALDWIEGQPDSFSFKQAWETCPNDAWMEWLITELNTWDFLSDDLYKKGYEAYLHGDKEMKPKKGCDYAINCQPAIRRAVPYRAMKEAMRKVDDLL